MANEVICLESDDEVGISISEDIESWTNEPIEILSEESDFGDVQLSSKPIEVDTPQVKEDVQPLTPQQLMRKQMNDAAERRRKRELDPDEEVSTLKPAKESKPNPIPSTHCQKSTVVNNGNRSRIRMIANPDYCEEFKVNGDVDAVSLSDMVGSKDMVKTYQFNMLIDFDYLEKYVMNKSCEFILINKTSEDYLHVKPESWEKFNIKTIDASSKLPKFGSHHSKMMINFYKDSACQIIIHTMNMTEADHKIQTQMCWMSPLLYMHKNTSSYFDFNQPGLSIVDDTGTVFKRDFIAYLMNYENPDINKIIDQIGKYDFSPIDVVFVGSTPGKHSYQDWNSLIKRGAKPMFGYGRLWQVIHMLGLQSLSGKFVGQTSTIAGPCDNWKRNTLVHVLTSCAEKGYPMIKKADYEYAPGKNKLEPVIIWPTVGEVLKSRYSAMSGIALHFTNKGKWEAFSRQFECIKKYLHRWTTKSDTPSSSAAGRSNLSPHVKTYTVTEDNFKTVKWFLMTSANISHQAWGKSVKFNLLEYTVSSFEAGVFIAPELLKVDNQEGKTPVLVPAYGKDSVEDVHLLSDNKLKIAIRVPYDTPLQPYTASDEPWCQPDSDKYL